MVHFGSIVEMFGCGFIHSWGQVRRWFSRICAYVAYCLHLWDTVANCEVTVLASMFRPEKNSETRRSCKIAICIRIQEKESESIICAQVFPRV